MGGTPPALPRAAPVLRAERLIDDLIHRARIGDRHARAEILDSHENLRPPVGMHIVEPRLMDDPDDRHRLFATRSW